MLGGVALVDKAERVIENTTINRVNEVIIITIDGANESTVISAKILKIRAVAVPVVTLSKLRLTLCAKAEEQKNKVNINKQIADSFVLFITVNLSLLFVVIWCVIFHRELQNIRYYHILIVR